MAQNSNNKIRSKRKKTRFWWHAFVIFICFLIACVTWFSVMYTEQAEGAHKNDKNNTKTDVSNTAEYEALPFATQANG